jgi:hypothetical protein
MFGLPVEVITLLLSTVGGAVMKMWSQSQQDKAEQQKALMQQFTASEDSVQNAREYNNPSAAWIRRFIVISFVSMAGFILTAPLWGYSTVIPVDVTEGFKFLFLDFTKTVTQHIELTGMVTPTWLPHSINAIIGFYFGQAMTQRR